jgi:FkbH-like protein
MTEISNGNDGGHKRKINAEDVYSAYRAILKRDPENQDVIDYWVNGDFTLDALIGTFINSREFAMNFAPLPSEVAGFSDHNGRYYTVPQDLRATDTQLKRVVLQGSCLMDAWLSVLQKQGVQTPIDIVLFTSDMPETPPYPFEDYSFHIAQIPLRGVLLEGSYSEWLRAPIDDQDATDRLLREACEIIDFWMVRIKKWAAHIPTFVINFMTPQYNVNGRHFHNVDAGNNIYLIEQINRHISQHVAEDPNLFLLDINHLASVYGRRFVQDDGIWQYTHGGFVGDHDSVLDTDRIVTVAPPSSHYEHAVSEFISSLWLEAEALYRSLRSIDTVKMVCIDLDDTLWRGVLAEAEHADYQEALEGWPLGMTEALLSLRRRGIILVLVSKNDPDRIKEIWPKVFQRRLTLDDFAILKISWHDKAQAIGEAMQEANLLPRNVIFVDDNPREREVVAEAFPDMRVIQASHYYWKRILMWSAETQGAAITAESSRRSDMIKSQVVRDTERKVMSREDFLARLDLRATYHRVTGTGDPRFARTLELLNKTNQFNTTGKRWTAQELDAASTHGTVLVCEVADRHADYGLVNIGIVTDGRIEQVVMSCRVVGLDVEIATIALLTRDILANGSPARSITRDTDANHLSRDLFKKCGWVMEGEEWTTSHAVEIPSHITVTRPAVQMV